MKVTEDIRYVGVNDHNLDMFESMYKVPKGMAYNSYVIIDEKIAVMDSVEEDFGNEWLENLRRELKGRTPDYLVVQHMEPDHSANIVNFLEAFPNATVVSNSKAFAMLNNYFGCLCFNRQEVKDNEVLCLGKHNLQFLFAPMVHWPEVMVTYDSTDKVLFSADAFGKFGALDCNESWDDEARRYYIGIVGKYGVQVQALLKKISQLPVEAICPLHGPVLTDNIAHCLKMYDVWSGYGVESDGVLIAYTSVYGHTEKAALFAKELLEKCGQKVGSARFGTLRPFASRCRRIPLRQNSACHNHLQHAGVSAYAQFRAFSHRQKLSKPHPCDNRKRFLGAHGCKGVGNDVCQQQKRQHGGDGNDTLFHDGGKQTAD